MSRPQRTTDHAALRHELARVLRPFVDGTAAGMESSVLTQTRVAATARDAADAVLPLLGSPPPSAHRVRGLIAPVLTCSWTELDGAFERMLDRLIALPPALPDVPEPEWDDGLEERRARRSAPAARVDAVAAWSTASHEGDVVAGPAGTVGVLVRADRRHALIVADGRSVRAHSRCTCDPLQRRSRGEVAYERLSLGRRKAVLDVRAGAVCALCRAPITPDAGRDGER